MATGLTLEELQKRGAKPVQKTGGLTLAQIQSQKTTPPDYFGRVGQQYAKSGQEILSSVQNDNPFRAGLRTVGAVAESAFAPITEIPLVKGIMEKAGNLLSKVPAVNDVISQANELAAKHPQTAKDIKNIVDILSLGAGNAVEQPLKAEVGAIGRDIAQSAKVALTPSEEALHSKVVSLFQKSIKPTSKKTLAQADKYENNVLNALKTIKNNAESLNIEDSAGELVSGRAPQTINELSQGVDQTKKLVFNQYDSLAKQAGTAGATIDAKPIADEVFKVSQNKALQLTNPEVVKYAEDWSKRLRGLDVLDTETTQEVVKLMNTNLDAFYRNPTYDTASKVAVDAGIANNFRQSLDKAIESATGEQYQVLKNQYASLKAIENDVTKAAMRDARKNVKGLLDYTDILTSGQMVGGILSLNPAMFTKGAIERGFKEYIKFLNDPNRAVSNMFDKLSIDTSKTFTPESLTGKYLKNPTSSNAANPAAVGLGIQQKGLNTSRPDSTIISKEVKPTPKDPQVENLKTQIAFRESGTKSEPYKAVNSNKNGTSDYGKYQVNEKTLKTYGKKFLGKEVSPKEFLASPELQEKFMDSALKHLKSLGAKSDAAFLALWHRGWGDVSAKRVQALKEDPEVKKYLNNKPK